MIIADTGFWFALASPRDQHHPAAVRAAKTLSEPLITTWPVMAETCHLLLVRLGAHAPRHFVRDVQAGASRLFDLSAAHLPRISELMQQYENPPMDLADASLVILAEDLGHGRIFSTDQRDFNAYRWKQHHPFDNLLLH